MASLRPVLNKQHSGGSRRNSSNSSTANNHAAFGNNKFRVRTFRASTAPSSQCDPNNGGGSSKKTPSSNVSTTAAVTTNLTEIKLVKYPFMQRGHLPVNEAVFLKKVSAATSNNSQKSANNNNNNSNTSITTTNTTKKVPHYYYLPVRHSPKITMTGSADAGNGKSSTTNSKLGGSTTTGSGSGLMSAQVEVPDEKDARYCVLSYEQVNRLNDLMSEVINIHGRGNFPTIDVRLCDLVSVVKSKLEKDGVKVHEIRLNGSGASSVLASSDLSINYNDLDLIFSVDLSTAKAFERVKATVLDSLCELLPEGVSRKRMSSCSLKEAYVSKMVKVNDAGDRWSLISLGNNRAKTVELKFVHTMRRQYEFSVDSFHIMLDTLFLYYECNADATPISDNFYPTVVAESMYGDFEEALDHLHKKLIATKNPEEIRGGGLLKYCNLLCRGYRPASHEQVKTMERYMCSRFFIDFPDLNQQQAKLENYLYNHFQSSEDQTKYHYLMILYQVVDESTVCLMGHERRLTLSLIEDMAFQVYTPPMNNYYNNKYDHAGSAHTPCNSSDLNLLSPASSNSSSASSTASCCSIGSCSNMSNMSNCSNMSTTGSHYSLGSCSNMSTTSSSASSSNSSSASNSGTATPVMNTSPPPPPHTQQQQQQVHHQVQQQQQQHPPPPPPHSHSAPATIPTYEIVTSCQPAVMYSNGFYYTSFVQHPAATHHHGQHHAQAQQHQQEVVHHHHHQQQHHHQVATHAPVSTPPPTFTVQTVSPGQCLACSCGQWAASNVPQLQPQQS